MQTIYSPLVGKLLAGFASGGVSSSSDGGETWQPPAPGNGMSSSETVWSIGSLVPGVLFAATGSGVYRSLDNGSTWTLASDGITGTVLSVFTDEKAPNIIYAAGTDGVFRTINAGITWSNVEGPIGHQLGGGQVRALQQFTGVNETRLYAGTENGVYGGTTGHGLLPGPVRWRKVDNAGLGNNTIIWALKSFTTTPGVRDPAAHRDLGSGHRRAGAADAPRGGGRAAQAQGHADRGRHAVDRPPAPALGPQGGQDVQGGRQEGQEVHRYLEGCHRQARCGRLRHRDAAQAQARRR